MPAPGNGKTGYRKQNRDPQQVNYFDFAHRCQDCLSFILFFSDEQDQEKNGQYCSCQLQDELAIA
jgi:hypothetical protein